MALDDAEVRDAIEQGTRDAVATGLRMQATTLKGIAATMRDHARDLERHASTIEKGAKTTPRPVPARSGGGEGLLEVVDGEALQQTGIDSLDVSDEMKTWLKQFHERFRRSPFFAEVINTLAHGEFPMNDNTAQDVAGLLAARAREGGPDG